MSIIGRFVFAGLGAVCLSTAVPLAGHAQTGPIEVPFSNKCVSPNNGIGSNGAILRQYNCNGSSAQEFEINTFGDAFEIRHVDSGLCIQQTGGKTVRGPVMRLSSCNQHQHELFTAIPGPNGAVQLRPEHSGRCLRINNGSTASGRSLKQWNCANASTFSARHFILPLEKPNVGPIIASHSDKCLMPLAGGTSRGVAIVQSTCTNASNQQFEIQRSGTNVRMLHLDSGFCINQRGRNATRGADFVLWNCEGQASQFGAIPAQNGRVNLSPNHNDYCVDVFGNRTADNTAIIQWDCKARIGNTRSANQEFYVPGLINGAGAWDGPFETPVVAVAAAALPDGKVLTWSAYSPLDFAGGPDQTYTSIFDPSTGTSTSELIVHTGHDMFCPGISMMPDGEYMITGGSTVEKATIYDPLTAAFYSANDMVVPRGYQSSTTLANGDIFTVGGSWGNGGRGNKYGETYSVASGSWSGLPGIVAETMSTDDRRGIYRSDNHMWLFSAPNGDVFQAGPSAEMHFISTNGNGSTQSAGLRGSLDAMNGTAVMYDVGKVYASGGAVDYDSDSPGRADAWDIDINGGPGAVAVSQLNDMAYERTLHSSVVLPSGEVVVLGGQAIARLFTDDQAVLVPEIWNPTTKQHTQHPPMEIPRTYHSTALLLKDGRVWAAGGGLCGSRCRGDNNHPDAEIFTPPYLLNADGTLKTRPEIASAPVSASYGTTIQVSVAGDVSEFVLIRLGSATHAVNTDQRRVPVTSQQISTGTFGVAIPANAAVVTPGNYYLFAMSSDGVPSEAVTVNIQ